MRHRARSLLAIPLVAILMLLTACTPTELFGFKAPANEGDCPKSLNCTIRRAALADSTKTGDGTCNYSPLGKATKTLKLTGIVEHTTEGSADSALAEITNPTACLSWHYLVLPNGSIIMNVPPGNMVFSANNRYVNTQYIQVENVGNAEKCDITDAQYTASAKLASYLAKRYGFTLTTSTLTGHDSIPGVNDATQAAQHWDPGTCWDWNSFYGLAGARVPATQADGTAVYISVKGGGKGDNFVTLRTAPRSTASLVGDPYLGAGTGKKSDWGSKAVTGHRYVVAGRQGDWTAIWYGGRKAWFTGKDASRRVTVKTVTAKRASIPVYGRPMPEAAAFAASPIPASVIKVQNISARLTKYALKKGQSYVFVSSVPNRFYEGCDTTDCSGPFDGTLVTGKTAYLQIEWNHRFAFVKADDVTVHG